MKQWFEQIYLSSRPWIKYTVYLIYDLTNVSVMKVMFVYPRRLSFNAFVVTLQLIFVIRIKNAVLTLV